MGENKNKEETEDEEEVLAVLKAHTGSVNVVRFSPNGKVLASGADDNTVMLWTRYESSSLTSTAFGGGGSEVWRRILLCKGHSSDVTDLTWSPDCRRVASCSIDNTICVWDVAGELSRNQLVTSKPQAVLRHGSWVKGVSWDPVGLYLASASEDKSVVIWRTRDWQIEKKITGLYVVLKRARHENFNVESQREQTGTRNRAPHSFEDSVGVRMDSAFAQHTVTIKVLEVMLRM